MTRAHSGADDAPHGERPPDDASHGERPVQRSAFSFGGESLGYFGQGAGARAKRSGSPRSRRRPTVLLAGALVVLAGAAVAIVTGVGAGSGSRAPGGARASRSLLAQAAYVTTQAPGFHFTLSIAGSVGEHSFSFDGEGAMDEHGGEGTMSMTIAGQQVDEIFKNPYVYMRLPAEASALSAGKPWVRANLDTYSQALGAPDPFQQGGAPTRMLSMLDHGGQVSELGSESVRGVSTTHYHALVDFAKYAASAPAGERATMQRYARTLERLTGSSSLPIDVWLDAQGRVRRFSIRIQVCTRAGTVSETVGMELFDFGAHPAVDVPAGSEFTDLSGALASSASQTLAQAGC